MPQGKITDKGMITHSETATRQTRCSVRVTLTVSAHLPWTFVPLAPSIDYSYTFIVSSDCKGKICVTGDGAHDGFPVYEVYVQGSLQYSYDPRPTGQTPLSLFGSSDTKTGKISYGDCGPKFTAR